MKELKKIMSLSKSFNVLYVEDNEGARVQTLKMLGNFFSNVTIAMNGLDGLEKFKLSRYDLVLSDLNMPVMDGMEMIKNIRLIDEDVVTVVISAHNETSFIEDIEKYGVDGYMIKPVYFDEFIETITAAIKKILDKKQ